ncbi:hypothetical protein [Enterococcus pallens]|uniref:Uncharacterized protein n=1 Tax=Enterococcus pallens ATCC BAA-351 TaxID=1158607 RepID=R2SEX3_9ENTE|nr:hypothetical protein [Enterococcus pallens]EOH86739.1 hypothetical protein UAU_05185 [Enterococcus pallens ATCC BAA-351]EOU18535.1 hypothetical protein I588_03530 [Enterococcus pallens ATCC BAA-351]
MSSSPAPNKKDKRNPMAQKDMDNKINYNAVIDDLVFLGYELAQTMLKDDSLSEHTEGVALIKIDERNPEKLAAISGFIEAIVKAAKN